MANINITSDAWTEISITSGTVQNISATADIELSAEQTDNSGVVLKPSEIYQWDNETIYARAVTEEQGALRVVNFKKAAGGGGYVLPVASSSTLGGVKVGSNLSIDASGVLSATGGGAVNYSTTEQQIGTWIDGNPLYQKTINITAPSGGSPTEVDLSSYNISKIVDLRGMLYDSSHVYRDIPFVYGSDIVVAVVDSSYKLKLYVAGTLCQNADCYITLQYTKTTD